MPRIDRGSNKSVGGRSLPISNPGPKKRNRSTSPSGSGNAKDDPRSGSPPKRPRHYPKEHERRDEQAYAAGKRIQQQKQTSSVNELKSKIRDTKRLLNRVTNLPADVRVEKERALVEYERELEEVEAKKETRAMISRYHFVRFLERKQSTRNLNYLLGQLSSLKESGTATPIDIEQLEEKIDTARIDLNYAIYCPLGEKYIALFPKSKDRQDEEGAKTNEKKKKKEEKEKEEKEEVYADENNEEDPREAKILRSVSGEKPPLWYAVKQSMEDGTLDQLRDGKLGIGLSGEKTKPEPRDDGGGRSLNLPVMGKKDGRSMGQASKAKARSDAGAAVKSENVDMEDGSEDGSDGGAFFEL